RLRGVDGSPRAARRDGPRAARRRARVDSASGRRYGRGAPPSDTMSSRLGDALQKRGDLTAEQVTHATAQQREHGGALSTHLVRLGFVTEEKLLSYLEREYRLPVVDPLSLDIPREVLGIVPQALVTKHHLVPTSLVRSTLTLAMADPSNLTAINEVKFLTGYDVTVAAAAQAEERAHGAHQGEGAARHRRAPPASGRPHQDEARRQQGYGLPGLRPAHHVRREGGAPSARQVEPPARHDQARLRGGGPQA